MCLGVCYKVEEGIGLLVVVAVGVGSGGGGYGYGRWWQWVLAVVMGLLVVKEMRMRIKDNKKNNILMKQ